MLFKDIKNNDNVINTLRDAVRTGSISHAYIFEGPENADKMAFALAFVKAVLCKNKPGDGCDLCNSCLKIEHGNYSDLLILGADDTTDENDNTFTDLNVQADTRVKDIVSKVKTKDIERLLEKLKIKPFDGERNIAVINHADTMGDAPMNKLLKTLEEPVKGTILILLSENTENLLPTIISRCITYKILPENAPGREFTVAAEELLDIIANGRFYQCRDMVEAIGKNRCDAMTFLDGLELVLEDRLLQDAQGHLPEQIMQNIHSLEVARQKLLKGMNTKYALKSMILEFGG